MRKFLVLTFGAAALQAVLVTPAFSGTTAPEEPDLPPPAENMTICHVPPGNPGKSKTITVETASAADHLARHAHDAAGPCPTN